MDNCSGDLALSSTNLHHVKKEYVTMVCTHTLPLTKLNRPNLLLFVQLYPAGWDFEVLAKLEKTL